MTETVIEVANLTKRYGDILAVNDVSFEVRSGEVFSILGPNGAGKTTLVEMLECLRDPTSGSITILGLDTRRDYREIIRRIGVLPQKFDAFDLLTVKENISYFAGMFGYRVDVDSLIETVSLGDKADELFKNLSGGLKQRVGVAISLVNDPEIVFLDEPTTGLDPKARRDVWQLIKDLREKGKTVILTTHYMEEAEVLSDRIAIMNQGKFITIDTTSNILERYGGSPLCIIRGGRPELVELLRKKGEKVDQRDGEILVRMENKRHLPELILSLEESGIRYDEIVIQRSTLEDVFLSLTGKRIVGGELTDD